jgi:hypothetical protein
MSLKCASNSGLALALRRESHEARALGVQFGTPKITALYRPAHFAPGHLCMNIFGATFALNIFGAMCKLPHSEQQQPDSYKSRCTPPGIAPDPRTQLEQYYWQAPAAAGELWHIRRVGAFDTVQMQGSPSKHAKWCIVCNAS